MKKKKKRLDKYQGIDKSIVGKAKKMATSILSNIPSSKIQGITGTTNVNFPTPSTSKSTSDSTSKSSSIPYSPTNWNPNIKGNPFNKNRKKMEKGGFVAKQWTRNNSNGSRRCK